MSSDRAALSRLGVVAHQVFHTALKPWRAVRRGPQAPSSKKPVRPNGAAHFAAGVARCPCRCSLVARAFRATAFSASCLAAAMRRCRIAHPSMSADRRYSSASSIAAPRMFWAPRANSPSSSISSSASENSSGRNFGSLNAYPSSGRRRRPLVPIGICTGDTNVEPVPAPRMRRAGK